MSPQDNLLNAFARRILSGDPLPDLVKVLRELRDADFSAADVLVSLEKLRRDSVDGQTEDVVLELMDYVTGFRPANEIIWKSYRR